MIGLAMFLLALAGFVSGILASAYVPSLPAAGRRAAEIVMGERPNIEKTSYNPAGVFAAVSKNLLPSIGRVAAFLWRWKWALLVILLFFSLSAWVKSCVPFGDFGKSRAEIARERDQIRGTLEMERELARAIVPILGTWERTRAGIERDLAIGAEQIESAALVSQGVPHETQSVSRAVFVAWARADQRLCDGAGGCGDTRA